MNMMQEELPVKLRRQTERTIPEDKAPCRRPFCEVPTAGERAAQRSTTWKVVPVYPLFYDEPDWVVCPFILSSGDFWAGHPVNPPRVCWQRGAVWTTSHERCGVAPFSLLLERWRSASQLCRAAKSAAHCFGNVHKSAP